MLVVVRSLTLEWLAELAGALDLDELSFSLSADRAVDRAASWRDPTG